MMSLLHQVRGVQSPAEVRCNVDPQELDVLHILPFLPHMWTMCTVLRTVLLSTLTSFVFVVFQGRLLFKHHWMR